MVFKRILTFTALLAVLSCGNGKYPLPKEETTPKETDSEEPGPEDPPVDVPLTEAFNETFDSPSLPGFLKQDDEAGDFRYYPGFPSLTESGNTVLLLRLDARHTASVTTGDYVHFGSYSVRLRLPDISAVQPKVGAKVEFGPEGLSWVLPLSEPVEGSSGKFYIYGLDWSSTEVVWWVKATASGKKTTLRESTENVPQEPVHLILRYGPDGGTAPKYPYELEIDWIEYSPSEP